MSDTSGSFLHRPPRPLPDAVDFDPWNGHLDARHAWKSFGGLSIAQAHELFLKNPLFYQEDFMFMGPKAFAYYFPVIDRYLRDIRGEEPDADCCAGILGTAIAMQLSETPLQSIAREAADLAAHVIRNVARYTPDETTQHRILHEWHRVTELAAGFIR